MAVLLMMDTGHLRCLIVKMESYTREQVASVVELGATVEGFSLGDRVLERLSAEGARRTLRLVTTQIFCCSRVNNVHDY
jgi:DNA helicase TIP49 (TBP-interacting protein)